MIDPTHDPAELDRIAEAAVEAAEHPGKAPAKIWHVGPDAEVRRFSDGNGHPFDGLTITHWTHD